DGVSRATLERWCTDAPARHVCDNSVLKSASPVCFPARQLSDRSASRLSRARMPLGRTSQRHCGTRKVRHRRGSAGWPSRHANRQNGGHTCLQVKLARKKNTSSMSSFTTLLPECLGGIAAVAASRTLDAAALAQPAVATAALAAAAAV